jgi:hypothetical protein
MEIDKAITIMMATAASVKRPVKILKAFDDEVCGLY